MAFRQRVSTPSPDQLHARFLLVGLHDTILAIWADTVRGVLTPAEVPRDRSVVLLGEAYEETNLAVRLGLRDVRPTAEARFVLCSRGQARCVVSVERVLGLTDVRGQDILPLPSMMVGKERLWFRGVFLFREGMALVLNPDWLVQQAKSATSALAAGR